MLYTDGEYFFSKNYLIHIVDRVGGGDSFGAGLIYACMNDLSGLLPGPEVLAVVKVAGNGNPLRFSSLAGFQTDLRNVVAQRRGDAGEVEPLDPLKATIDSYRLRPSAQPTAVGRRTSRFRSPTMAWTRRL